MTFTREREDSGRLVLSKEAYDDRRERYVSRVKSILDYAQEEINCRSQVLLSYFGEKNTQPCGQCDICLKNKENAVSDDEFSAITRRIREMLEAEPSIITSLVRKSGIKEQKIVKVIRFLLDDGQLEEDNFGRLILKK